MAYRLQLPADSAIHPVFHISQLKAFHQDHTPVYSTLPAVTDLEATAAVPERILKCRLVKKGNNTVPQVLLTWTGFPASSATWEDYNVGQAEPSAVRGSEEKTYSYHLCNS